MVFSKLFNRQKSPENIGKNPVLAQGQLVNRFYLEFSSLEGDPIYLLEDSLTIGSAEDADIVLSESEVSPSHCSVNLNQDVLSVVDHGSSEGTFVNKKRVPSGKMIILQSKDKLRAGSVPFKIVEREEVLPSNPVTMEKSEESEQEIAPEQALVQETPEEELPKEELPKEELPKEEPQKEEPQKPEGQAEEPPAFEMYNHTESELDESKENTLIQRLFKPVDLKKEKKPLKAKKKGSVTEASNGFLRALGLICDFLIVGIIHNFASHYFSYTQFLKDLPQKALELVFPYYELFLQPYVKALYATVPALENIEKAILGFYKEEYFFVIQLILLVALFRLATPLIFGVTLGQALVGIRAKGQWLLKRALAPVRAFFGFLFLPFFWIFDFPTLFSKRSLKEVASGTHLETPSTLASIFSFVFFIPALTLVLLASPVFKGFELPQPAPFSAPEKIELGVFSFEGERWSSNYFKVGLPARGLSYLLPHFRVSQIKGKKSLSPFLTIAAQDRTEFELSLLKEVSLVDLLRDFARSNPLAGINYPQIVQLVNDASNTSKSFKQFQFSQNKLAREFRDLLQASFSLVELDAQSILTFLKKNGPFFGPFVDFKNKMESLMGPGATGYELKQIGNAFHIVADFSDNSGAFKKLLPLNDKKTKLYQISKLPRGEMIWPDLTAWNIAIDTDGSHPFLNLIDLFSSRGDGDKASVGEVFQNVYERYHELGKLSLAEESSALYNHLNSSVEAALAILMNNGEALGLPEQPTDKLTQNLTDLLRALKEKDLNYFGASAVGDTSE
ncbi:MAG: FHA domain-containing protein [Bacteriovoracaceae bacterium]